MEHVEEYCHTQTCQQMNSRFERRYSSNRSLRKAQQVTDEAHREQNG